jgi:hypothetical protein
MPEPERKFPCNHIAKGHYIIKKVIGQKADDFQKICSLFYDAFDFSSTVLNVNLSW